MMISPPQQFETDRTVPDGVDVTDIALDAIARDVIRRAEAAVAIHLAEAARERADARGHASGGVA